MAPDEKPIQIAVGRSWPWWRWGLTGLSTVGLVLSVYLAWHYLVGGSVIGCGGGSPCEEVLSSRWSAVRGILPVSGLAMGAYLAMLLASFFIGPGTAVADRRLAWGAMLVLACAAAGSAVWFIILQRWVIGAFCPYCMATHITGLLLAGLVVGRTLTRVKEDAADAPTAARRILGIWPAVGLAVAGLALAGALAAGEILFPAPAVYRGGVAQATPAVIDPHKAPMVGSPDAPFVVKLFFDYECPHCQKVHSMLKDAISLYDGKLAFVLCPAPLNSRCNPYVALDVAEFKDSCDMAKISLAVWVAKREAFADFDDWMFTAEPGRLWHARSLEATRAKAVKLVGQAKLDAALANPWIGEYMKTSMDIYGDTIESGNAVPKLVYGSRWVTPEPYDVDELVLTLQQSVGLPKP